LDVFKPGNE